MIANNTDCPTDDDLRDFSAGRLPNDRFGHLLSHLDSCESCQARADRSSDLDDSFAAALAKNGTAQCPIIAEPDCQAALFQATTPNTNHFDSVLPPIEALGPYRLLRPLGRGGMGAVYLAEHERLRKKCAIKLLPRERGFDADWLRRFEREMQAVASLDHPNIVTATDAGDSDGWHYLVMEYLDGVDLASLSRRIGPIPIDAVAAIGRDICRALSVVHEAGLIHRDIKPSNVMLTRGGTVKLLDLGLVLDNQTHADDMRLTTVGQVMGTLAFAAPEQLSDGNQVDARSDLYGLGATLFQLIAGQPAHTSNRGIAPLVIEKTSKPAGSLKSLRDDVPDAIDELISRLLDRDPDNRPATATEVASELEPFAASTLRPLAKEAVRIGEDRSTIGLPYGVGTIPPIAERTPPRQRTWIATAFLGAAALIAGFVFYIKTDNGTLVVESEVAGVTVSIKQEDESVNAIELTQGENRTTLRSGNYSIEFDADSDSVSISESEIVVRKGEETVVKVRKQRTPTIPKFADDEELFRGKPFSHWIQVTKVERSLSALRDAMLGIANLADDDDVEAAHAILIAARRLGGWVSDGGGLNGSNDDETNNPSWRFMNYFNTAYGRMMMMPGVPAIIQELDEGNARSRAACLWALRNSQFGPIGSSLSSWVAEDQNSPIAIELHDALRRLLRDGIDEPPPSSQTLSHDACRKLSLQLALAMERPLADEPGLEKLLNEKLQARLEPDVELSLQEIFEHIMITTEPWTNERRQNDISVDELTAAKHFGIQFPLRVVVESTFDGQNTNEKNVDSLLNDSAGADATLAWMGSSMSRALGEMSYRSPSWPNWLESIAQRTTRPEVAVRILERLCNTESVPFGGSFRGSNNFATAPSPTIQAAAEKAIRIAESRLFDDLESTESLPTCIRDDVREQANQAYENYGKRVSEDFLFSKLNPNVDWNGNGEVTEAEYAWSWQKDLWRKNPIPGTKPGQHGGGFGGGGQF